MVQIENISQWLGRDVCDADGEKVGKLEDIYYTPGGEATLALVKSGLLGRQHTLVPLEGATAGRDHLRIPQPGDAIAEGPTVGSDGITAAEVESMRSRYGVELDDSQGFESGNERDAREQADAEARQRAAQADQAAADAAGVEQQARERATEAAQHAQAAAEERQRAEQAAAEAHRDAGDTPPSAA